MQANEISTKIIAELKVNLENRVDKFKIIECTDIPYSMISIEFEAYKFFHLRVNYDRGRFGCSIKNGNDGFLIETTEKWFAKADLKKFCNDIKNELESRIPDKYLIKHNWK